MVGLGPRGRSTSSLGKVLNKNILIAHPCGQLGCSPLPRELWSRCPTQDSTSLRRNWASSKTFAFPPSSTFSPERCNRLALPPALSSYPPGCWRAEEGVGEAETCPGASWRGRCPWWRWQAGPSSSSGGSRGSGSSGKGSRSCGRLPTGCRMSPLSLLLSWVRVFFNSKIQWKSQGKMMLEESGFIIIFKPCHKLSWFFRGRGKTK